MSAWQYRVTANGQSTGVQVNWSHLTAVAMCKENRGGWPAGTVLRIERRRETVRNNGAWLPHRCYVVGADGEARRIDPINSTREIGRQTNRNPNILNGMLRAQVRK